MKEFLLVALGSALGGMARHGVTLVTARLVVTPFPVATLAINIAGSFLIGLVFARGSMSSDLRLFLTVGILGGFTTFSAFSIQTVELWRTGQVSAAVIYIGSSVAGSVLGAALGVMLGSRG
jgi:fluoride exporter